MIMNLIVSLSWENGKLLMTRENFVQELIFYDKDNIPDEMFKELSRLVENPLFRPELIMCASKAAAGICSWVHSVQKYSEIYRNMQPRLKNLLQHEEKFTRVGNKNWEIIILYSQLDNLKDNAFLSKVINVNSLLQITMLIHVNNRKKHNTQNANKGPRWAVGRVLD